MSDVFPSSLNIHFFPTGRVVAWLVAVSWVWIVASAARGLPRIPNLLEVGFDVEPEGSPWITVIVPARNESLNVKACLESLIAQDYPHLRVLAVDDRSNDATGSIMDTLALGATERLEILQVVELPPQWLGKTHAMAGSGARCNCEACAGVFAVY